MDRIDGARSLSKKVVVTSACHGGLDSLNQYRIIDREQDCRNEDDVSPLLAQTMEGRRGRRRARWSRSKEKKTLRALLRTRGHMRNNIPTVGYARRRVT